MRCVALFSGGLDSQLAVRLMQRQGIEIEAINFKTIFTCCQELAGQTAHELGVRLTVISTEEDYLDLIRAPRFGYGKGANPCIDCRIYMFKAAKQFMERVDARFVISGEVIGQRPMSQKRNDLDIIAHHSGLDDLLLRPLSAKSLPPTLPEREKWVDRERLFDFVGRSRKGLIALAHELGIKTIPQPSTGCALTEPRFSLKVYDLMKSDPDSQSWDFELLRLGRHFRFDSRTKVIVGRDEAENESMRHAYARSPHGDIALFVPHQFAGPSLLLVGPLTEEAIEFATSLMMRYSKIYEPGISYVSMKSPESDRILHPSATPSTAAQQARTLASV